MKSNFTFKRNRPTGKWAHLESQHNYTIKLNKLDVGSITEIRARIGKIHENEGKFEIGLTVFKKDPMEDKNPNCLWRWVFLKQKFENPEEAMEFIKTNADGLTTQFNLRCVED